MSKLLDKISTVWNKLLVKLDSWFNEAVLMLPNLFLAVFILTITIFIARWVNRLFLKLLKKFSDNNTVNKLLGTIATMFIVLIGLFIALDMMKLDKLVTSLLAGAGVVGLVLGLAFQEPIMNTVAGVVLAVRRAYKTGDLIETNSYRGNVEKKALYYTTLHLPSGQKVVIPNKLIVQSPMINYSTFEMRRVELDCGIQYDENLDEIEKLVRKALDNVDSIKKSKDIEFFYTEFGAYAIQFRIRFWIDNVSQGSYYKVKSEALRSIKSTFDENGIVIPFPIQYLHIEKNKNDG